jgi:hypothetical protein
LSSKAPRVFEWIEDDETGFLLRTPITRSLAQDNWHNYTEKQRRYNSILNEWDLCIELEPDGVGRAYEDDSDDDCDVYMVPTSTQSQPTSLHPAQEPNLSPPHAIPSPAPQPMAAALHDFIPSSTPRESTSQPPVVLLPESSTHNVETSPNASPPPRAHYTPQEFSNSDGAMPSCILPSPAITAISAQDHAPFALRPAVPAHDDPMLVATPRESTSCPFIVPLPTPSTQSDETPPDLSPLPPANFVRQECTEPSNSNSALSSPTLPSPAIASRDHAPSLFPGESAVHHMIPIATSASQANSSLVQSLVISASHDVMPMSTTCESSPLRPITPADTQMADGVTTVAVSIISAPLDIVPTSVTCESSSLPLITPVDTQMANRVTTAAESIISTSHDAVPMLIACESSTLPPITPADVQMVDGVTTVAEQDVSDMVLQPGAMHDLIYNSPATPLFPLSFTGTLADDVYEHYGFIGPGGGVKADQQNLNVREILGNHSEDRTWSIVRKSFGDVDSFVDPSLQAPLTYFLARLLQPAENPLEHLASLWDLAIDSVAPLVDHMNTGFRLVRCAGSANSDAIYFISAKNRAGDDVHWQIMLTDAATVLACFRQEQAHTLRDLALFLLRCGRSFSTRIQRSKMQLPSSPRRLPLAMLGWRPQNHRPTVSEYNFYENLRKAFFTDHCHSRAALLKGGIIWRLAVEGSGGLVNERVLEGPSEEALVCGACLASVNEEDSLWDDELSESDMDLICGVYKYATSEFL